jgi:TolB-like protein/DNA-binding winged helix-turn-helix (wHTH) protein
MPFDADEFRFGRFLVDTRLRTLTVDGRAVRLHARAFDILALLILHRDRPVGRHEILEQIFAGQIRSDGNVPVQVHNLRRAISAAGGDPHVIQTVGQSYRFVGEIYEPAEPALAPDMRGEEPAAPLPSAPSRGFAGRRVVIPLVLALVLGVGFAIRLRTLLSATPAVPRLSIVVLPFRNLGSDKSQDYLADAITDDLTIDLAHIPASMVIARESAETFKDKAATVQQIGRDLRVRYVLDGSLTAIAGAYVINASLSDTETGATRWTEHFEIDTKDMSDARTRIVRRIASTLDFQLNQIESVRSKHDRPDDPDAIDLFFRARAILDVDDSLAALTKAQKLLEEAIREKPDFADAQAELGRMLLRKSTLQFDPTDDDDQEEARNAIAAALSLAPQNVTARVAQARALWSDGRYDEAEKVAGGALAIEPSSADAESVLIDCAYYRGHLAEASAHIEAVTRLNPDGRINRRLFRLKAFIALVEGYPAQAIDLLTSGIIANISRSGAADTMGPREQTELLLIAAYAEAGDLQKAMAEYETVYRKEWPHRSSWRYAEFYPKAIASLAGFTKLLAALEAAGMPRYADEHSPASAAGTPCGKDAFSPSPAALSSGGQTLDTRQMLGLIGQKEAPLIIDVGLGAAVPAQAVWQNPIGSKESATQFAEMTAEREVVRTATRTIIVMGDGPYGCDAYMAAEHLADLGYRHVAWYRGGEEAWARAWPEGDIHKLDRRT